MKCPLLIIFSGLPGTGKTTLAREIAARFDATYLRIDSIEQAIRNSTLQFRSIEDAGYLIGYAVAEDNLKLGRTVVSDSVNPIELTRAAWLAVAERAGCKGIEIEIICSDRQEHRQRIEQRVADLAGHSLPTWNDVVARNYEAWARARILIDTAGRSVQKSAEELQTEIRAANRA